MLRLEGFGASVEARERSLAATLGFKNGDVLQAVNNTKIESANTPTMSAMTGLPPIRSMMVATVALA